MQHNWVRAHCHHLLPRRHCVSYASAEVWSKILSNWSHPRLKNTSSCTSVASSCAPFKCSFYILWFISFAFLCTEDLRVIKPFAAISFPVYLFERTTRSSLVFFCCFFARPSGTIKYVIAGAPRLRQFIDHQPLWMKGWFHGRWAHSVQCSDKLVFLEEEGTFFINGAVIWWLICT